MMARRFPPAEQASIRFSCRLTPGFPGDLGNHAKYVTNVESYDRRIQSAINIQGRKMQRRAEFLLTRALRRAGWR